MILDHGTTKSHPWRDPRPPRASPGPLVPIPSGCPPGSDVALPGRQRDRTRRPGNPQIHPKSKKNRCENRCRKSKQKKHDKSPKMYPGSMLNSMGNRYDSGTFDFLIFAKSITLKSFFHTTPGTEMTSKFYKKLCLIRWVETSIKIIKKT